MMPWRLGEPRAALPLVQAGLDVLRRGDDRWQALFALHQLAHLTNETGDPARAIELFQESVEGYQAIAAEWGVAIGRC
jgi:hypothetical protein